MINSCNFIYSTTHIKFKATTSTMLNKGHLKKSGINRFARPNFHPDITVAPSISLLP